jgi:hypothetical protein
MRVSLAYALPSQQIWMDLDMPESATVLSTIQHSGILDLFPHIDLQAQKVGIFGRVTALDTVLAEGDRVEIYRPIIWQEEDDDDDDDDLD